LVPVLFTFHIQDVLKLKNNYGAKRLITCVFNTTACCDAAREFFSEEERLCMCLCRVCDNLTRDTLKVR